MKMDWPMFHRDVARSGYTPEELSTPLKVGWVLQTEGRVFFASPTVSRGYLLLRLQRRASLRGHGSYGGTPLAFSNRR